MDLKTFQAEAAKHVSTHKNILQCLTLGLGEEAGEVVKKITKLWRYFERTEPEHLTEEDKDQIVEELSDNLWYITQICELLGRDSSLLPDYNLKKLELRRKIQHCKVQLLKQYPDMDTGWVDRYFEATKSVQKFHTESGCLWEVIPGEKTFFWVDPYDAAQLGWLRAQMLMSSQVYESERLYRPR